MLRIGTAPSPLMGKWPSLGGFAGAMERAVEDMELLARRVKSQRCGPGPGRKQCSSLSNLHVIKMFLRTLKTSKETRH